MLCRFPGLITTILALTALTSLFATKAASQEIYSSPPVTVDVIRPGSPIGLSDLINKAFSQRSGDFFDQASASGQLNFLFGWGDFPVGSFSESNISEDSLTIKTIVKDYFQQQGQREPDIRTRDIENPFNSSLQQNPSYISD